MIRVWVLSTTFKLMLLLITVVLFKPVQLWAFLTIISNSNNWSLSWIILHVYFLVPFQRPVEKFHVCIFFVFLFRNYTYINRDINIYVILRLECEGERPNSKRYLHTVKCVCMNIKFKFTSQTKWMEWIFYWNLSVYGYMYCFSRCSPNVHFTA